MFKVIHVTHFIERDFELEVQNSLNSIAGKYGAVQIQYSSASQADGVIYSALITCSSPINPEAPEVE